VRPRKPARERRSKGFTVYLTPPQAEMVRRGAKTAGVSLNQYLIWLMAAGLSRTSDASTGDGPTPPGHTPAGRHLPTEPG